MSSRGWAGLAASSVPQAATPWMPAPYSPAEGSAPSPPSECALHTGLKWALAPRGWSGHLCTGISGKGVEAALVGQQSLQNESAGERAQSTWVNH